MYYEINSDYDPKKPVVLDFFDLQQPVHYSADELKELSNLDFNFIRFYCRGFGKSYIPQLLISGNVQWQKAWKVLDSENIIRDAEAVRQDYYEHFKPLNQQFFVMGESGGAMLALQYLAEYPDKADRAFLSGCTYSNKDRNLNEFNFIQWLTDLDPKLPELVENILNQPEKYGVEKEKFAYLLQRMGYDRYWDKCYETRCQMLINSLISGDMELYQRFIEKHKYDFVVYDLNPENKKLIEYARELSPELSSMDSSEVFEVMVSEHLGVNVRIAEFYFNEGMTNLSYGLELASGRVASPALYEIWKKGELPVRNIDCLKKLAEKELKTSIFIVDGYYDHVIPHQSVEKIGQSLKNAQIALLNDNHTLNAHTAFLENLTHWFMEKPEKPTEKELLDFFSVLKPGDLIYHKF